MKMRKLITRFSNISVLSHVGMQIQCMLLSMVLLLTGGIGLEPIQAETMPTESVIDENALCSLTIVKYEDYHTTAEDPDASIAVGTAQTQKVHKPMGEAGYALYRIAGLRQGVLNAEERTVSLEYESFLRAADHSVISIPSGLNTTADLSRWVMETRESSMDSRRAANLDELLVGRGKTNEDGILVFDQLPVGVYMLYEEETPSDVLRTANQCVVLTLPATAVMDAEDSQYYRGEAALGDNMAGDSSKEGRYWDYDIIVRPKNNRKELSVEKHIQVSKGASSIYDLEDSDDPSNDVLTDTEDFQIGDAIPYWVSVEVPEKIGELKYFYLEDRISQGQTFINDTRDGNQMAAMEVWGQKLDGTMEMIPQMASDGTVNWHCTNPGEAVSEADASNDSKGHSQKITTDLMRTFDLYFNTQTLSVYEPGSLHRTAQYKRLYVRFHAILNSQAIIGGNGNENDIALKLSHMTEPFGTPIPNGPGFPSNENEVDTINPQCIDTRVYTYEVCVLKKGEGVDSMEGVEFELRNGLGQVIKVSRDASGYYIDEDCPDGGDVIRTDEEGCVRIRGLRCGIYELVETKTLPEYNLLKTPISLTIESEADYFPFTYLPDPQGEFFRIEEGREYYILRENEKGESTKVMIDLDGMEVGDYIRLEKNQPVYSSLPQNTEDVFIPARFTARGSDSESMHWKCNFGIDADGVISLTVYNRKGLSIPGTGGQGTVIYTACGIIMILMAIFGGVFLARKKGADQR